MRGRLTWKTILLSIVGATLLVVAAGLVVTMPFGPTKTVTRTVMPTGKVLAPKLQINPKISVTPSSNLHNGEGVLVKVVGVSPGGKYFLSECATSVDATSSGCGDQLAAQPFIVTDPSGAGSMMFNVKARAATKPYNTTLFQTCTVHCVIMATGSDVYGSFTFVSSPLKFSK